MEIENRRPSMLGVIVLIGCLAIIVSLALTQVTHGPHEDSEQTRCIAQVKELVLLLNRYKSNYGSYPTEDGKAFVVYPFFAGMADDPRILKCPGGGASDDVVTTREKIQPFIWTEGVLIKDHYNDRPRQEDFSSQEISYTGPYNSNKGGLEVEDRWRLMHLISPTPEEKQLSRDEAVEYQTGHSNAPLVSDDNDGPQNHPDPLGTVIGYADNHVSADPRTWDSKRHPFSALVDQDG